MEIAEEIADEIADEISDEIAKDIAVEIAADMGGVLTAAPQRRSRQRPFALGSRQVTTAFIDENPDLLSISTSRWNFADRSQVDMKKVGFVEKLMRYLANLAVNGHPAALGADPTTLHKISSDVFTPTAPKTAPTIADSYSADFPKGGWRSVLLKEGPKGFAKRVRGSQIGLIRF